jgi:uncharacterized membrane protein YfcA
VAVTPALIALTLLVSILSGGVGALLGVGGGIFLVPFLSIAGLPFRVAVGTSLLMIIATSTAVAMTATGRGWINLRLGMLLEVATAIGGLAGGLTAQLLTTRQLQIVFSITSGLIGVMLLFRINEKDVPAERTYRVRRLPVAMLASLIAGNVSGLLGIGGGIVKVPALVAWCGVPMRAATLTSAFMLGVTATSSAVIYYAHGEIVPALAAAAVIGALIGSRAGLLIGERTDPKWLRMLLLVMAFLVSAVMFARAR